LAFLPVFVSESSAKFWDWYKHRNGQNWAPRGGYIGLWGRRNTAAKAKTFGLGRATTFSLVDGTPARADWPELSLFDLEGQHIEQAGDAIVERLEQGLLLQLCNVEVKA